jgi:alkylation response protein AidB-like acyl-CoA dehydrogenase
MDFSIPDALEARLETIRDFVREELHPLESRLREESFDDLEETLEAKRQTVRELGLWAPHLSETWGGPGLSLVEFGLVAEALGRSPLGHYVFNCQAPDAGNMEILIDHGSDWQQERFLEPLIDGESRSCFSMTEPDRPGSNPTWMETTARREGDAYVLDGRKWFTSSADGADFAIVMAVTDPEAERRHERASLFVVPTDVDGFERVRNISVMGEEGSGYLSHAEIVYDDCRVPVDHRLGGEGEGFAIAQERLGPGRIHHCMRWIGICERAFELMCRRANSREVAPGERLGDRQMIQEKIADSRAEIDAARLMTLRTAWAIDQKGMRAVRRDVSAIKYYVAGVLQDVLDRAIQVHGALGVTDDTPLAWWYRHERGARIYDGPDEVHKRVVAEAALDEVDVPAETTESDGAC